MTDPDPALQDRDPVMGTRAEAEASLLAQWRHYTPLCQPLVANAKAHKRRECQRLEAERRMLSAACLLAWHMHQEDTNYVNGD